MAQITVTTKENRVDFIWSTEKDHHATSGKRYVLRSSVIPKGAASPLCSDDRVGVCSFEKYSGGTKRWRAVFWFGYESIFFLAGTPAAAMRALEREIDKRSIGLFGVDDVTFAVAS